MNHRVSFRGTAWRDVASLLVSVACVVLLATFAATVLDIGATKPRDRAVPAFRDGPDSLRITVLGTSLSSANRYQWPDIVGARVSTRLGRPVNVERITQPGATSAWGVDQIDRVLATNPDIVLVEFAVNDADARNFLTVGGSMAQHEQIFVALRSRGHKPAVVLLTMNPAFGPRAWLRPFLSRYYAEYVALAERNDTGMVDLYARWRAFPDAALHFNDGLHPSDTAATLVIVGPVVDAITRAQN